ncbi:MAG: beta-ketoacyl synthase chain length factor [Cyclobacteriaceae bacterium]|nr:beta-ketoacyl synthase chain length factor [Cyclobacteriaceae bacterium]
MKAYINATSSISSQSTLNEENYLEEWIPIEADYHKAVDPNYRDFLDPKMARRMARIIKMGVVTSSKCLEELQNNSPGAIIIGTGLGCLQDTAKFLKDIVETEEGLLSPTAFIQSTHNTIAGQIALLIGCTNHNFTYANRGFSFENALGDALLHLEEGNNDILVGGIDEVIPETNVILQKLGCFQSDNGGVTSSPSLGEGATMFLMSSHQKENSLAVIQGMKTLFKPNSEEEVIESIYGLLVEVGVEINQIDGVLMGYNNSKKDDDKYDQLVSSIFQGKSIYQFKNISGEYFTASAFGCHLATKMIAYQKEYPQTLVSGDSKKEFEYIVVYNHFHSDYHSVTLLSKC